MNGIILEGEFHIHLKFKKEKTKGFTNGIIMD